jgi:hypothetical protein
MTMRVFLYDRVVHFQSFLPRAQQPLLLEDAQMVGGQILREVQCLPDFADAAFAFLQQTENAQAVLVADPLKNSAAFAMDFRSFALVQQGKSGIASESISMVVSEHSRVVPQSQEPMPSAVRRLLSFRSSVRRTAPRSPLLRHRGRPDARGVVPSILRRPSSRPSPTPR